MLAIVDYAKGNLMSVARGLAAAGARDVQIVSEPEQILQADAVVLPGVGAFADAAHAMQKSGQMDAVRQAIDAGTPFLGICLGLHLLFEAGTEGADQEAGANAQAASSSQPTVPGLGVIPGIVDRMPNHNQDGAFFKVPHVGWNTVHRLSACDSPLLAGIDEGEHFYFTHSYIAPPSSFTHATCAHSVEFPCFVDVGGTCFGVQFHPEKSSDAGLRVLANFVSLVR